MLQMVKRISGMEYFMQFIYMQRPINMKDYNKNKESSYLMYCNANNLCVWTMSQK